MIEACACACPERVGAGEADSDACAIILAGGSGERFGDPRGKQFVELAGLPLVAWSILAFDRAPSVDALVVVCAAGRMDEMRHDVLDRLDLLHEVTLAPGGQTRQDSVLSGLMATPEKCGLVAIHDGARPLIEQEAIERCLAAVREDARVAGAICAARVTDTIKVADENGVIGATPDRSRLWAAQTPQVFRRAEILAAHEAALLEGFVGTDDASLVERRGGRVVVVDTPRDNLKVTLPEDLGMAEAILAARLGIA
ncbi:MAG: 2-C-methyl-D-erythritol 4-phosphate cytidylyltransferase [Atopobiaceae bacterium]|nr:2-C-methyl-D-erythritol 4-phosphate cytidylyltransferase [Atopobiaceae bacterium]MBR3315668.1 2-C-methyl-D-erythritol 4-phosphate cytidylyltransferase [Atopobiaceae bacterium]